jgi:hypothetical protein
MDQRTFRKATDGYSHPFYLMDDLIVIKWPHASIANIKVHLFDQ